MTSTPPDHDLLALARARHPLLGGPAPDVRQALLGQMQPRRLLSHDVLAAPPLGVLASGRLVFHSGLPDIEPVPLVSPAWFGSSVQPATVSGWQLRAAEDSLVGLIDAPALTWLLQAHPALQVFVQAPSEHAPAHEAADPHLNLTTTPVRALVRRPPITTSPDTSIRAVAELMREQRVSSVMLVEQGHLFGIVTDRDLRNRALAAGLDTSLPVHEIATIAPLTVDVSAPGFEALLLMARHNIHHVPVVDGHRVAGMITATDVTEQHSTSAVYLAGEIHKQTSLEGLVAAAGKVKVLQKHLAAADATASSTGFIVTAITDAITSRLLQLAELRFGPAPVDYAWVAAGSQARHEQTAKSDQDNCLVLDDAYDPAAHGEYFKSLSTWVCDGLAACGYVHCPGEMMAMTDKWRRPQREWAQLFARWVDTPEPMALMLTCVFFDVRVVAGNARLLETLRQRTLQRTRDNRLFLAHMVGNALSHQPPLGLFGGLSVQRSGEHKGTVDLKHNGLVPIIDLARVYALAAGHPAVNTHERLAHAAESGEISQQGARDLRDALEHLAMVRIRHQSRRMAAGFAADNHLRPDELSGFERSQLRDAFGVVKSLQDVLAQRYRMPR